MPSKKNFASRCVRLFSDFKQDAPHHDHVRKTFAKKSTCRRFAWRLAAVYLRLAVQLGTFFRCLEARATSVQVCRAVVACVYAAGVNWTTVPAAASSRPRSHGKQTGVPASTLAWALAQLSCRVNSPARSIVLGAGWTGGRAIASTRSRDASFKRLSDV